jgi:hypothetical protein
LGNPADIDLQSLPTGDPKSTMLKAHRDQRSGVSRRIDRRIHRSISTARLAERIFENPDPRRRPQGLEIR